MMYHISTTGRNFEAFMALWELPAKRLATIGQDKEVWEITCHNEYDYAAMQDAADAWETQGNEWEQLDTPWDCE
jgi:hypothetical protein